MYKEWPELQENKYVCVVCFYFSYVRNSSDVLEFKLTKENSAIMNFVKLF